MTKSVKIILLLFFLSCVSFFMIKVVYATWWNDPIATCSSTGWHQITNNNLRTYFLPYDNNKCFNSISDQSYTTRIQITNHNNCKQVWYNWTSWLFIPANTETEWTWFLVKWNDYNNNITFEPCPTAVNDDIE